MKTIVELNLGFSDAVNYKKKENKALLDKFFVRSKELDALLSPNIYFLVGDKGTGKTAYSVYLSNNEYRNTLSQSYPISETEYVKFIALKKERHLTLSDYTNIWKVLLLLLMSKQIVKGEDLLNNLRNYKEYANLQKGIDAFYDQAFSPEIITALNIIENAEDAVKIMSDFFENSSKKGYEYSQEGKKFQFNLLKLEQMFKRSISKVKLTRDHILFIDGIDIRPRGIAYEDYLECVKGLANATWQLDSDYLSNIKDSKGRMRVILLLRPDIFATMGLQNQNNKMRDNCVLLDWKTTYPQYRKSGIFNLADKILSVQQEENKNLGECWDYYFPFKNKNKEGKVDDSFVSFLRFSMFRPRDIITLMSILQNHIKNDGERQVAFVTEKDFDDPQIRSDYSDYLLGEIKDYLEFYHTEEDYKLFLKFFEFLNGKATFTYDEYMLAYNSFADYIEKNEITPPEQFAASDRFLQFLYDLNVICYLANTEDNDSMIHWSFREKSYSNFNPAVKEGVRYRIHYGLQKALDTGKRYKPRRIVVHKTSNI